MSSQSHEDYRQLVKMYGERIRKLRIACLTRGSLCRYRWLNNQKPTAIRPFHCMRESCLILRQERDESPRVQDRLLLSDLQDQHTPLSTYAVSTTGWIWIKFTITILTVQKMTTSTALLQLSSYLWISGPVPTGGTN